jgi:ribosome-binding protein aMBF1 (putative translation factor)
MSKARTRAQPARTPAEVAREKALREKYQRSRPTLSELAASGDYEPPISQGEYWELMNVLAALRKARAAAGLSLADMKRRTGIDRAALSRLENAVTENPTIETLSRYAGALGKRLVVKIVDVEPKGRGRIGNDRKR